MAEALTGGHARPDGVIGTTFTNKAANELRERVRQGLIEAGKIQLANKMGQALLGTVNSVCGRLLERFAFEAGLSPNLEVLPEDDQLLFNQAVEESISLSDPELMQAVLREVQNQGGITEVLKKSWRSRPSLISYTNSLFVPAFRGKISPDQVRLTPERKEATKEPAVINWVLKGKNKSLIGASLTLGIHQLVEDKYKLVDPSTKKLRSIRFDDIAVLARFNDTVTAKKVESNWIHFPLAGTLCELKI